MTVTKHIFRSLSLLSTKEKRSFAFLLLSQSILALLDIVGIAAVGIISFVAINGYSGTITPGLVGSLIEALGLDSVSFNARILILSIFATSILVFRTIITVFVTKRGLRFLSLLCSKISVKTYSNFLDLPFPEIQRIPKQEVIYLLTIGINRLILGVLGSTITIVSDSVLILLVLGSLMVVDLSLALSALLICLILGLALRIASGVKTTLFSSSVARSGISINSTINATLENYREMSVKNVKTFFVKRVDELSTSASINEANMAFMPLSSKYILESGLILATFSLAGVQFLISDAKTAIANLAVFMAAGARVMPAVLRIQLGVLSMQASVGTSENAWKLIERTRDSQNAMPSENEIFNPKQSKANSSIALSGVFYQHDNNLDFAVDIEQLNIEQGEFVAVVGPSGSGKSTLADLILGVLTPKAGSVLISGKSPKDAIRLYPGLIAYIPQKVFVADASVKENISYGYDQGTVDDSEVLEALRFADLKEWVESLPEGIYTQVGESGYSMSGGQQQRLGIARALYSNPRIIVMDEATSALDSITENRISTTLEELKGKITTIVIAHRLSTIKNADRILYLKDGKVTAEGSFIELRKNVKDFDQQASIMGF